MRLFCFYNLASFLRAFKEMRSFQWFLSSLIQVKALFKHFSCIYFLFASSSQSVGRFFCKNIPGVLDFDSSHFAYQKPKWLKPFVKGLSEETQKLRKNQKLTHSSIDFLWFELLIYFFSSLNDPHRHHRDKLIINSSSHLMFFS